MSKGLKILLAVVLTCFVLMVGSGMLLAATIVRGGMVTVKVNDPETHFNVVVPAGLVTLGMDLLPLVIEEDICAEIRTDLGEYGPAAAAALLELEDAPDAVLVDIRDGRESVRITKEGRLLEIYVKDDNGTFEISVPARLLGKIAREIA
jgi:Ethanolamine utilization protein EutJ (predicted chaperonin)